MDDSQPTIDIIQDNRITYIVKHIAFSISYNNGKFDIQKIRPAKILTCIQTSDGAKRVYCPILERDFSCICGIRFYPLMNLIIFLSLISIFALCLASFPNNLLSDHLALLLSEYNFIIILHYFLLIFHALNISKTGRERYPVPVYSYWLLSHLL